ncbi:MAG: hypothetical protein OSB57_15485, partial [Planctomycetota bacterium]|nr:hypothetical protein [Planctomycetota bacterium]
TRGSFASTGSGGRNSVFAESASMADHGTESGRLRHDPPLAFQCEGGWNHSPTAENRAWLEESGETRAGLRHLYIPYGYLDQCTWLSVSGEGNELDDVHERVGEKEPQLGRTR